MKVWQALIALAALVWIGRTPRKRAVIAMTVVLLLALGIGPAG